MKRENKEGQRKVLEAPEYDIDLKDPVVEVVARKIQAERYEGYDICINNNLDGQLLIEYALPVDEGRNMLNDAAQKFKFSMRSYNRVLRVARTIADLAGSAYVKKIHIAESINYRNLSFLSSKMA